MNYQRQNTCVFPSPSKIPYGGFSPVRLQTGIPPRPSPGGIQRISPRLPTYTWRQSGLSAFAAHQRANRRRHGDSRTKRHVGCLHRTIPSRGPWLASALCCHAGSSLTMASSEPLAPFHALMHSRMGPLHGCLHGGARGSPIYSLLLCLRAALRTPVDRMAASGCTSPSALAFAIFVVARHPHIPLTSVLAWVVSRGCKIRLMLRPEGLHALHRQGLLHSSSHGFGSLPTHVEDNYAGKQPISATGLTPARNKALWAANERASSKMSILLALSFRDFRTLVCSCWNLLAAMPR